VRLALIVPFAALLFAACEDNPAGPGALATIAVTPNPATLAINGTQQFTAVGKDAGGNVVAITPTWSVVASGGAIKTTGMFTAGTVPGTFTNTVKATSGSISGTATVTVTTGSLATIAVTPNPAILPANAPQQFTAVGNDAGGNVVAIAPTWSVVAGGGAISNTGLFTAGAVAGTFTNTVKATSGSISGTATVTVNVSTGGPAPVVLGAAANYVILAKSAISNVPTSAITGNLGLSPAAASFITGFALNLPAGGAFSTSAQVTGNVYASDYAVPTPADLTTAIGDMQTAYVDAAGRPTPDYTELASGSIGGLTLPAGLYKWSNTVTISSDVTLNGNATDVWIFQIAGGITQASATNVILTGGALAKNIFWQSFGVVSIGTTAHMEGQVLAQTSITLATGASANGRLLAQTAVTLAGNTVVQQ
ncbi:MAG: ice-binding family protein, partial [Planctomycetota bacterium]